MNITYLTNKEMKEYNLIDFLFERHCYRNDQGAKQNLLGFRGARILLRDLDPSKIIVQQVADWSRKGVICLLLLTAHRTFDNPISKALGACSFEMLCLLNQIPDTDVYLLHSDMLCLFDRSEAKLIRDRFSPHINYVPTWPYSGKSPISDTQRFCITQNLCFSTKGVFRPDYDKILRVQ